MQALADHDVAFESHIYAYGPHGFSTCDSAVQALDGAVCRRISGWVEDSIGWLKTGTTLSVLLEKRKQGGVLPSTADTVSGAVLQQARTSVPVTA